MGEQKCCKTKWMPTTPVSGESMEASARQELMDTPREAQLKLPTGLFFAESESICLKLQKSQQESNFTQVSPCCSEQSQHRMCFSIPARALFQFYGQDRASLCPASCKCPHSPGFAHVLWCCFTTSSQHPRASPAPS